MEEKAVHQAKERATDGWARRSEHGEGSRGRGAAFRRRGAGFTDEGLLGARAESTPGGDHEAVVVARRHAGGGQGGPNLGRRGCRSARTPGVAPPRRHGRRGESSPPPVPRRRRRARVAAAAATAAAAAVGADAAGRQRRLEYRRGAAHGGARVPSAWRRQKPQ